MKKLLALLTMGLLFWAPSACISFGNFDEEMAEALVVGGFAGDSMPSGMFRHTITKEPRRAPVPFDQRTITQGEALYKNYCFRCHGSNAEGDGPYARQKGFRSANLMKLVGELSKNKFIFEIREGNTQMPDWNSILNDQEMDAITSYLIFLDNQNNQ